MSFRRFTVVSRTIVTTLVAAGLAAGLVRAAQSPTFAARQAELRRQWEADQKRLGLAGNRQALYAQYPTPEIGLCTAATVAPGASTVISFPGRFPAGTTFVSNVDAVQISRGAVAAGAYSATVTAAPDARMGFASVNAYTPVSGAFNACSATFVGSVLAFDLRAANGWTIKMTPTEKVFKLSSSDATLGYHVEFFRSNEPKPFEVRDATLRIGRDATFGDSISVSLREVASPLQGEMEALTKKMGDMQAFLKLSEAEQNAITDRFEKVMEQYMAQVTASVSDPAAMVKKQNEFGCSSLTLGQGQPGRVTGQVSCGATVGQQQITGTSRVPPA